MVKQCHFLRLQKVKRNIYLNENSLSIEHIYAHIYALQALSNCICVQCFSIFMCAHTLNHNKDITFLAYINVIKKTVN